MLHSILVRRGWLALVVALLLSVGAFGAASADSTHVVQSGETLTGIASRYGVTIQNLASANGLQWNSWVYTGQALRIPGATSAPAPAPAPQPSTGGTYTVQAGDTLYRIALNNGTTVQALMNANGLTSSTIYVGQRLRLSGTGAPVSGGPAPSNPAVNGEKWIDVNLTTQTITAFEGQKAIYSTTVSTGLPRTPTVVGTYQIYVKYVATDMQGGSRAAGDYYYLRDVPYTMYFYRGYGIHGTYWHNNFGQPMSHGCVNLRTPDAKWFFEWAEVGTKVVSHY